MAKKLEEFPNQKCSVEGCDAPYNAKGLCRNHYNILRYSTPERRAQQKQNMDRVYKTRRNLLNKIKLEAGCVDCGYNIHPAALEFDHVNGDKEFEVGRNVLGSLERVMQEIAKCEVRCANCHRIRTHKEMKWIF